MKLIKTSWTNGWVWVYGPEESDQKFCRGVNDAVSFGRVGLNIPHTEIICGIMDCVKNENDVVEFGDINGLFLFSRKGTADE